MCWPSPKPKPWTATGLAQSQPDACGPGLVAMMTCRACMKLRVRPHFCFFFFCFFAGLVLSCSTAGRQEVTEKKQPQHSVLDLLDFGPLLLGRRGATAAAAWPRPGFGSSLGAGPKGFTGAGSPASAAASSPSCCSCWARRFACMLIVAVLETRCRLLASSVHSVRHSRSVFLHRCSCASMSAWYFSSSAWS